MIRTELYIGENEKSREIFRRFGGRKGGGNVAAGFIASTSSNHRRVSLSFARRRRRNEGSRNISRFHSRRTHAKVRFKLITSSDEMRLGHSTIPYFMRISAKIIRAVNENPRRGYDRPKECLRLLQRRVSSAVHNAEVSRRAREELADFSLHAGGVQTMDK